MLPNYLSTVRSVLDTYPAATIVQPGVEIVDAHGNPSRSLVDDAKQRMLPAEVHRPRAPVR